jgi:2-oxoglutarate dehydrogenase E2 component (dihydrolipoamide succinyltransferase)
MKTDVEVPSVGESVSQGYLASWLKDDGETVNEGDELFELETDKATVAVPAPASGVLHIAVEEGTDVEVGQVVASLDTEAEAGAPAEPAGNEEQRTPEPLSPAVRRVVAEHDLDVSTITGTGKDGRVTKQDALEAAKRKERDGAEGQAPAAEAGGTAGTPKGEQARQPAAKAPAASERPGGATPSEHVPAPEEYGELVTRKPMSRIRRTIAQHLVAAQREAAHLTTFNEINMERVMASRGQYRDWFEKRYGVRLGFMSFFVKACCLALKDTPEVNAQIDGDDIVYYRTYNIGVAVSTDRGLIIPVIKQADRMSFARIETRIGELATAARERRISPDDLAGGTFTITNGGVFGSLLSTPIPSHPQAAILGMHTIQKRPVAVGDQVLIKPMMYVALTYDHRIIDGREAVQFLVRVKGYVEEPDRLLLEV